MTTLLDILFSIVLGALILLAVMAFNHDMIDAAIHLHKDFGRKLKYARLWGSGKHEGIMVKKDHPLADGDIIELHI